jgi:ferric-dicitrate binding protein FerR (iron transport regulator)
MAQGGAVSTGTSANYAQDPQGNATQAQIDGAAETTASQDQAAVNAAMSPGDSHVRIVRLSEVIGKVKMDRTTGQGLEQAIQNMPIVEGAKLETEPGALAGVEFEDQSTIGLAPGSLVEFPQLIRRAAGGTDTTVKLVRGTLYLNLAGTKGNSFLVQTGADTVTVNPGTHLRLETNPAGQATLAVFSGSALVRGAAGSETMVGKKESLTLGTTTVAKNVEKNEYDAWDKEQIEYQQRYSRGNAFAGSPGYGISDLNYYGSFVDLGCGPMWQPYFVSASWDPFQTGLWASYPGAGYSWVSPYPWGWLPYHSGSWAYCGGAGWGWRPGGSFYGLRNVAIVTRPVTPLPVHNGPASPPTGLPRPPHPPSAAGQGLVVSTRGPIVSSKMEGDGFVFQKNSAGLGIPRGQLGSLNKISNEVGRNGAMAMPVDVRSVIHGHAGPNDQAHAPVMIRPAGAPEVHANSMAYRNGIGATGNPNGGGANTGGQLHNPNAGGPPHNTGSAGGPPPAPHSAGGGGNFGGANGGGGHMGGGGAPAQAASGGGTHK